MVKKQNTFCPIILSLMVLFLVSCSNFSLSSINVEDNSEAIRPVKATKNPEVGLDPDTSAGAPEEGDGNLEEVDLQSDADESGKLLSLWVDQALPEKFLDSIVIDPENAGFVEDIEFANTYIIPGENCIRNSNWVYALVAPFPTWQDGMDFKDLQSLWKSGGIYENGLSKILVREKEYQVFKIQWGEPDGESVQIVSDESLLETAWDTAGSVAIIPFEEIRPRWKVLTIDGSSPFDQKFDAENYKLTISLCLTSSLETEKVSEVVNFADINREDDKFTSVVLTGVTALVRATASQMEINGIRMPGEKIYDWLVDADFTHISNEVAFAESCPYPDPYQTDLRFCSDPRYIDLFNYLDIDIVELTGNHIQDWSKSDFVKTLDMYEANGMAYYAGGRDISEAKKPLLIEHHGNKLAFLGCNAVGPGGAFATSASSGNPPCGDYEWLIAEVRSLAAEGYLPIVTLQHNEFYSLIITGPQIRDFNPIAEAGAVVVSGSQAHYPNPFGFVGDHFIHYGLGNLFFDQMDAYIAYGIQREFIDRHIFYDGEYIGSVIYTAYLENFSQPRPMTSSERMAFLKESFIASGWK